MQSVGTAGGALIQHFLCPCLPCRVVGVLCCAGSKGWSSAAGQAPGERAGLGTGRGLAISGVSSSPGSLLRIADSSVLTLFCTTKTLGCLRMCELVQRDPFALDANLENMLAYFQP